MKATRFVLIVFLVVLTQRKSIWCQVQDFETEDEMDFQDYYESLIEEVDDSWFLPYRELIINWEDNVASYEALQPTDYQ